MFLRGERKSAVKEANPKKWLKHTLREKNKKLAFVRDVKLSTKQDS